jgi:hypothetical protein
MSAMPAVLLFGGGQWSLEFQMQSRCQDDVNRSIRAIGKFPCSLQPNEQAFKQKPNCRGCRASTRRTGGITRLELTASRAFPLGLAPYFWDSISCGLRELFHSSLIRKPRQPLHDDSANHSIKRRVIARPMACRISYHYLRYPLSTRGCRLTQAFLAVAEIVNFDPTKSTTMAVAGQRRVEMVPSRCPCAMLQTDASSSPPRVGVVRRGRKNVPGADRIIAIPSPCIKSEGTQPAQAFLSLFFLPRFFFWPFVVPVSHCRSVY